MITGPMEFHPYDLPLPNQILPCAILNEEATGLVAELEAKGKDSALGKLGYEIKEQKNVFMWAMWVSISAYLKDFGYRQTVQVQYQAVPQDDGSLGLNEPKPVNVFSVPQAGVPQAEEATFFAPWLGCRCSWPCTQQCWYFLLGAQVLQWVAVIFCLILVAFEILLLECMMVENFLAEVPHTLTWVEWWYLDEPFLPRFIWIVGKLIVIPLAIGDAINSEPVRARSCRGARLREVTRDYPRLAEVRSARSCRGPTCASCCARSRAGTRARPTPTAPSSFGAS